MIPGERHSCRHDIHRRKCNKNTPRTRSKSIAELPSRETPKVEKNASFRIFFRSLKLKLDTRQEIQVKECWEGKAKGLMQVLWGWGLIDHGKTLPFYTTLTGPKDAHEIVNHDSSLRHIMSMCTAILKDNKEMMSTLAETNLWVSCLEVIMFTPKCPHAEIACREGVAYMCAACAKGAYKASETCHWRRNEGGKGKC